MKEEITEKKGTLSSLWIVQRVIAVLVIVMAFFPIAKIGRATSELQSPR